MSDIDISTPNTAFGNLQDGSILLFQKNSDGTFSPLALNRSLAEIVQQDISQIQRRNASCCC